MRKTIAFFCILIAVPASLMSAQPPTADTIRVEGVLLALDFFGPPNYGEQPSTDKAETAYVLQLPASADIQGVRCAPEQDSCHAMLNEAFLQVIATDAVTLKGLAGRKVEVAGTPRLAETGHHRTRVVLDRATVRPITAWSWGAAGSSR